MTLEMILVLIVILVMLIALALEISRPEFIISGAVIVFVLTGILTTEEALKGFSNEGMLTIALLFIVASAVQKHARIDQWMMRWLNRSRSVRGPMLRFFVPTAFISAFLNNTPIVVMLLPIIRKWCQDRGIAPSKFLIPLSYMTILGGTLTLIGTSTNLVVHGMLISMGYDGFSLFQLGIVGLPISIVGMIYLLTVGYRLLPNNAGMKERAISDVKEYMAEMTVESDFPYLNHTVKQAGLRELKGLFLIEIVRGNERISPVRSSTLIREGDRLIFTGLITTIAELQKMKGLALETGSDLKLEDLKNGETQLIEAVVSHRSELIAKSIKQSQFRSRFDAGILAVHRNNERVKSKVGDIILRPGDTLLLLTGPDFIRNYQRSNDFYVVTPLAAPEDLTKDPRKGWISLLALGAAIGMVALGWTSMFLAMSVVVAFFIMTKIVTPDDIRKSVYLNVLVVIAAAFGIGTAMTKSGVAQWAAEQLLHIGEPFGVAMMVFLVYLLTNIFTELLTNSAAAILMLPIGLEVAEALSVQPIGFAVVVAIAASASFITPIGYQTNMIVYGPGGYKFIDYVRVGTPLSLIVMVLTVLIVTGVWYG